MTLRGMPQGKYVLISPVVRHFTSTDTVVALGVCFHLEVTGRSPSLRGRGRRTGVRLSTPEGCDLGFYGCGDAGVPTGNRLRIVITAGDRWWSRSVYRAGPVQRAPLGPPQGTAAAHGQPGTAIFCPSGDTPPEMPQAVDAKGKHRRSLSTSSRGALRCFPSRRYLLPSPPARTQPSLPSAPARAPSPGLRSFPARPGAITARRRPATGMPPWRSCRRWARCGGAPAA